MEIIYRLTDGPNAAGWEHRHSCATATRGELLWSFFPGDVGIRDGEVEFETNFGLVPILHFGLSIIAVYGKLSRTGDASERYTFTEANQFLSFQRDQAAVFLEPSFRPVKVISQMIAMRIAVKSFTERIISDLGSAYPSLLNNPLAGEMITKAEALLG